MKDDRLISLNAAIDALNKRWRTCIIGESLIRDAKDTLKELPSATDTNVGGNLIDREAALDVLHGYFDGMLETDTVCPKDLYNEIEALPPAQPGWIPTSVKPPEPFKLVLIQDYCGCYELNTYIPPRINPKQYPNGYWGEVGTVDFDYFDVEAWCPLPAPYRPEGDDKHEG